MFVQSYSIKNDRGICITTVNKEVKFWARNGRGCLSSEGEGIFFDVKINRKFYFFSYNEKTGDFLAIGDYGVQLIGSRVPRVYYTIDKMQFCVTAKGRLWVKQL